MAILAIVVGLAAVYALAVLGERLNNYMTRNVLMPHSPAPLPEPSTSVTPSHSLPHLTPRESRIGIMPYIVVPVSVAENTGVFRQQKAEDNFTEFDTLQKKLLWHELTLKMLDTVKNPSFHSQGNARKLREKYIKRFENKMNPMLVAEITAHLVPMYEYPTEALEALQETEKSLKNNDDAIAVCKILQADILFSSMGDVKAAKTLLDEAENLIGSSPVSSSLHGRYYLMASRWHASQGHHVEFYNNMLRYLYCVDISSLSEDECIQYSKSLVIAALVGDGIYDFGELLCLPVLDKLQKSKEHGWLLQLLQNVHEGKISKVKEMKNKCASNPDLKSNWKTIVDKSLLLCTMQIFFALPANERVLTLEEVAKKTEVPLNNVESLIIKAMSRGLLRGNIDEVAGSVSVTWVRPRILNKKQLAFLLERLDDWCSEVRSLESWAADKVEELEEIS